MATHYVHNLSPVLIELGPIQIRWYGLMYVIGFIIAGLILKYLVKQNFFKIAADKIDSLITVMIVCMFIGARSAYVFIYNWDYYSENLLDLLAVWKGGLSFHGALVGLLVGGYIFARQNKITLYEVMDSVALAGTPGMFLGRIGNFINGELYGRITSSPVGIIFPQGGPFPRHASQLYEAFLEGILLGLILWTVKKKVKVYGILSGLFVSLYGVFRFILEFFREPDSQLGYYFGVITMGQILCFLMIFSGIAMMLYSKKKNVTI
ncbi:MAG: prolipoprotein diacylglyceryl transferase [Bacteriovorax sp.]|jgi:phosphatidylglycerol:prolipoprotein diacylglycerol transferase